MVTYVNTSVTFTNLAIDSLTGGGNGSNTATATQVIRYAQNMTIRATTATGFAGFLLPTDAQAGDLIEFLGEGASVPSVLVDAGFTLNGVSNSRVSARRVVVRLVDTTNWNVISSGSDPIP